MVLEPQVEDPCSVVKPIGTAVKMASKKVVQKIFLRVCLLHDARCYLV
jgi:hypothetical protein